MKWVSESKLLIIQDAMEIIVLLQFSWWPSGGHFDIYIYMMSYQHRDSHYSHAMSITVLWLLIITIRILIPIKIIFILKQAPVWWNICIYYCSKAVMTCKILKMVTIFNLGSRKMIIILKWNHEFKTLLNPGSYKGATYIFKPNLQSFSFTFLAKCPCCEYHEIYKCHTGKRTV